MPKKPRSHSDDLRGASLLAIEATKSVTKIVEAMHQRIGAGPELLGRPFDAPLAALNQLVYGGIRGVTSLVGVGLEVALKQLGPLLGASVPGPEREAVLAALNGILGDQLAAQGNPLATTMELRRHGVSLVLEREALAQAVPRAAKKLLVLVHGSSMNDAQWLRLGHDHGVALEEALGCTAVWLRYNSGLHISQNGRALGSMLQNLVDAWPVPVESVALLGHSMGGLVARSAVHCADESGHAWRRKLRALATLGSPHHGAPLERGGNWIDVLLGVSSYSAPLAKLGQVRSSGVTDLRYGNVRDEDWRGRDRFAHETDPRVHLPLPEGVACFAVAATTSVEKGAEKDGSMRSDGLVPIESALGQHAGAARTLAFPREHQFVALGHNHLDLLSSTQVFAKLRGWLS